ncbi:hypothetical protein [Kitasatospora aureofaciens]|uniref:hypothetical protein n=1 Tax=Kitasatospora aureofaciens TaxID=1894 RepID=UPI001C451305|nr:hypothetical protein [Kitasatospora aureofaciens]MBV6700916.1 hypothetical protein [Kitasatospora aureofaciens]
MRIHPALTALLAAAAALTSLGAPSVAAAPTNHALLAPAADTSCRPLNLPSPYVSPWGRAQVALNPGFKAALDASAVTVTPIAPVTSLPGDTGLTSAIGSTAGSYIDLVDFGRVYYKGGWTFTNSVTNGTWTADDFWLRFFPDQGLSTCPTINGVKSTTEQTFVSYTLPDALTGGGGWGLDPTKVAVKTAKVPLKLTPEGAEGINRALGTAFRAGDELGTLSGEFRYLPA